MAKKRHQWCRARGGRAEEQVHIDFGGFARDLRTRGYAADTVSLYGRIGMHFARWLQRRKFLVCRIEEAQAAKFLNRHLSRCHCSGPICRSHALCRAALHCLLAYLRREGLVRVPRKTQPPLERRERLLIEFDQHLDRVQGLAALTRRARRRYAREFLAARFGRRRLRLRRIKPRDLLRFVNARALTLKRTSVYALVVGLRSFFRFLELTKRIPQGLADGVPSPACPRAQPSMRVLDIDARGRFLSSFARSTRIGRRDYAIALCFTELALRANEVAELTLDDIEWRGLTLRLRHTKQRRERLLPLPSRVAKALIAYLQRSRPRVGHRKLFVSLWAPLGRPLSTDGVRHIIGRALARSSLPGTGPHILRRSWATLAHRRGADLKLIADILGHRSLETTAAYARVNFEQLRQAALPWPARKP